jgi:hypothetical protein
LRAAQRGIIVAGCCGMAYTQLTLSAASIDYTRQLGGNGLHVGVLNALPTGMLFIQFLAALAANHLRFRRPLWMACSLIQRVLYIPIMAGPWLWPQVPDTTWLWLYIAVVGVEQGLQHFGSPLWLSWMGDYLPHRGLNEYWGVRHLWMQWTAAAVLCGGALLLHESGMSIKVGFPVLVLIGSVLGVADILLFLKVDEPPVTRVPHPDLKKVLLAPFKHPGFRSFIGFMCAFHFAAMLGATFISLFLLQHVGMSLFQVLMLWTFSWIGGAVTSRRLGIWAERWGNKPVLALCTAFKSVLMISLLLIPDDVTTAFWMLVPVFMFDAALNTGFTISQNGFLLKNSPAENRTMYIAAGTALAGMIGGVTSVLAGVTLSTLGDWHVDLNGYNFTSFHLMFVISIVLRLLSLVLVARIQEPHVYETLQVVTELVGVTPLRLLRYPVGLYRSWATRELLDEDELVAVAEDVVVIDAAPGLAITPPVLKPEFLAVSAAMATNQVPAPHVRLVREEEPVGAR